MSTKPAVIAGVVAAVLLVAAGGAGFYFYQSSHSAPAIVEFIDQPETTLADSDALSAPTDGAPLVARVLKGVQIDVAGIVQGGKYAQVTLPDKRTAYIVATALSTAAAAPVATPTPAPAPTATASNTAQNLAINQVATVEFDPTADVYSVTKPVPVYIEPYTEAPQKYKVDVGTSVPAIQRSKDGVWIMASTEDGDPAYLQVAELGPPQAGQAVAALPDTVSGPAKVVTTSSLLINGQPVSLVGINGQGGTYATELQSVIDAQGGTVNCTRQSQQYVCKLASGIDIALTSLYNGGAQPTADAPDTYQTQAKAAQAAGRGVWAQNKG